MVESVDFKEGASTPQGILKHDGKLIAFDAGINPVWPTNRSLVAGTIF